MAPGITVTVAVPADPGCLDALAEGLVLLDVAQLEHARAAGVATPSIYACGARYRREHGGERWQSVAEMLQSRPPSGDCEDLAAWRVAELRCAGEEASVRIVRTSRGTFHAIVRYSDGTIEDPSRILHAEERRQK